MIHFLTQMLLAIGFSAPPLAAVADTVLTLHAAEATAHVFPVSDENPAETSLPSLDLALTARFVCPADGTADAVTFSVADTHKRFDAREIADAMQLEAAVKVPGRQLAPIPLAGFCTAENAADAPLILLPAVATARVSLRCRNASGTSLHFASSPLALRLTCLQDENQASSIDR